MTPKILIVDDEPAIRLGLQRLLSRDGYLVTAIGNGTEALELIQEQEFHLALLDIHLDGHDVTGIEILMALREQQSDTIVIIMTGQASLETSVQSLRQGAHDYLFKPYKADELRESVRTGLWSRQEKIQHRQLLSQLGQLSQNFETLKRTLVNSQSPSSVPNGNHLVERQSNKKLATSLITNSPSSNQNQPIILGELSVDMVRHTVSVANHYLDLSKTEFDIIYYLATQVPHVVSAEQLIKHALGYESEPWEANNTARQYIHRLRRKIKPVTNKNIIRTVRGRGYVIET